MSIQKLQNMKNENTNVSSVIIISTVCKTHRPHLAAPVDLAPPVQKHEPNTTVALHVW